MSENDILSLISGEATIPYRIYIKGISEPLTEFEIVSTTYEDYRYVDTDSIVVGQFVARTISGEVINIDRNLLIENKDIEVQMGVKVNETTTWYSLGNFLITKPEENDVTDKISFKGMDYTKKFNQVFNSSLVTFPCTALELAQSVCEQCGVELATLDFTNADFVVENNQYEDVDTCRKVMQDIGKLAYSWVRIGWDNRCYIDFEVLTEVEEHNIITNDNYYDFKKQQESFGIVNRVVIGMKDVDGENVAVEDAESIEANGLCELHIYDNNLTYTPTLRQQVIEGARRLFGLSYVPIEVNTTGHPWLIGNEVIRIIDMDGNVVDSYAFDRTIEYMGHIKSKIVSKAETQTQLEYVNTNTMTESLNRTKIVVDKQNQTITSIVEETETMINNNKLELQGQLDEKANISDVQTITNTMQTQLDANSYTITNIQTELTDGVSKVKTTSGTFDENGLTMEQTGAKTKTVLDADGIDVKDVQGGGNDLLFAGYVDEARAEENEDLKAYEGQTIVYSDNLVVKTYFTIGTNSRLEDYEDGTGIFYIGG